MTPHFVAVNLYRHLKAIELSGITLSRIAFIGACSYPRTSGMIAQHMGVTQAAACEMLQRLTDSGHLHMRGSHPAVFTVTRKGEKVLTEFFKTLTLENLYERPADTGGIPTLEGKRTAARAMRAVSRTRKPKVDGPAPRVREAGKRPA